MVVNSRKPTVHSGGIKVNSALKILIGIFVLLIGAWTMVNPSWFGQNSWVYGLNWWIYTVDIIKGSIGPVLIIVGVIVAWIAYEERKP
jgi:hypothetical protein